MCVCGEKRDGRKTENRMETNKKSVEVHLSPIFYSLLEKVDARIQWDFSVELYQKKEDTTKLNILLNAFSAYVPLPDIYDCHITGREKAKQKKESIGK